jgi:hypothetical protein
VIQEFPTLFNSWEPLTEAEKKSEPKINYSGPTLKKLDLSACMIWEQGWE